MSLAYICNAYSVPAKRGGRVRLKIMISGILHGFALVCVTIGATIVAATAVPWVLAHYTMGSIGVGMIVVGLAAFGIGHKIWHPK